MAQAFPAVVAALVLAIAGAVLPVSVHSQVLRNGPSWSELSAQDRQVLAPLASDWDKLDLPRKNKWLAVAKRYPSLPPTEQRRIQERMPGWAKLSSQERQAARENFRGLKQLPPEQRKELPNKWQEYQSLPPEQRQELRRAPTGRGTPGGAPPPTRPTPPPAPPATR